MKLIAAILALCFVAPTFASNLSISVSFGTELTCSEIVNCQPYVVYYYSYPAPYHVIRPVRIVEVAPIHRHYYYVESKNCHPRNFAHHKNFHH